MGAKIQRMSSPLILYNLIYMIFTIIGFAGMFAMNFSAIPQLIKMIKTKSVGDMTITREILLLVGCLLYLSYGIYRKDPVIITSNLWACSMFCTIIFLIKRYGK